MDIERALEDVANSSLYLCASRVRAHLSERGILYLGPDEGTLAAHIITDFPFAIRAEKLVEEKDFAAYRLSTGLIVALSPAFERLGEAYDFSAIRTYGYLRTA